MFCPQNEPISCIETYTINQDDMDAGSRTTIFYAYSASPNRTKITDETINFAVLKGVAGISVGEHDIVVIYRSAGNSFYWRVYGITDVAYTVCRSVDGTGFGTVRCTCGRKGRSRERCLTEMYEVPRIL